MRNKSINVLMVAFLGVLIARCGVQDEVDENSPLQEVAGKGEFSQDKTYKSDPVRTGLPINIIQVDDRGAVNNMFIKVCYKGGASKDDGWHIMQAVTLIHNSNTLVKQDIELSESKSDGCFTHHITDGANVTLSGRWEVQLGRSYAYGYTPTPMSPRTYTHTRDFHPSVSSFELSTYFVPNLVYFKENTVAVDVPDKIKDTPVYSSIDLPYPEKISAGIPGEDSAVKLRVIMKHDDPTDMELKLIHGTKVIDLKQVSPFLEKGQIDKTFSINDFAGMSQEGVWKLKMYDAKRKYQGQLQYWSLEVMGEADENEQE